MAGTAPTFSGRAPFDFSRIAQSSLNLKSSSSPRSFVFIILSVSAYKQPTASSQRQDIHVDASWVSSELQGHRNHRNRII